MAWRPLIISVMALAAVAAVGGGLEPSSPDAQSEPPTLVSTNLCADLLVLRLAAPRQILALSRQTRGLGNAPLARRAGEYPVHRGSIEELLALKPDIVLAYAGWGGRRHAELLARRGINILEMPYPGGWDDALNTARDIGVAIGQAAHADQVAAAADRRMRALAAQLSSRLPPQRMLYLRPNGGTAGSGTYVDDLFQRLGLRNLASELGIRGWGRVPLERLMQSAPDVFLLGYFDQDQAADGSRFARHPLLKAMLQKTPTIALASNGWGCGGLELLRAAEIIVADLARAGG